MKIDLIVLTRKRPSLEKYLSWSFDFGGIKRLDLRFW